jgi:hypothetical protein
LAESDAGSRGLTQLTNEVDGLVAEALAESSSYSGSQPTRSAMR